MGTLRLAREPCTDWVQRALDVSAGVARSCLRASAGSPLRPAARADGLSQASFGLGVGVWENAGSGWQNDRVDCARSSTDRAAGFYPAGWGFESLRARWYEEVWGRFGICVELDDSSDDSRVFNYFSPGRERPKRPLTPSARRGRRGGHTGRWSWRACGGPAPSTARPC